MRKAIGLVTSVLSLLFVLLALKPTAAKAQQSEDPVLQLMFSINAQLAAAGANFRLEAVEFYTLGGGRPSVRVHQLGTRWVPLDTRRGFVGTNLSYMVDSDDGAANAGGETELPSSVTDGAIHSSIAKWQAAGCLRDLVLEERTFPDGGNVDLVDDIVTGGPLPPPGKVFPRPADIIHAGWVPQNILEAPLPSIPSLDVVAVTYTFIFVDARFVDPTDANGDGYLDTAFKEIYYNNEHVWGIAGATLPTIDVETVALHENGHALELGHFGTPPEAVMNEIYTGPRLLLTPIDKAGLCAVFGSWPNKPFPEEF